MRRLIGFTAAVLVGTAGAAGTATAQVPFPTDVRCDRGGNCEVVAEAPGGNGGPADSPGAGSGGTSNASAGTVLTPAQRAAAEEARRAAGQALIEQRCAPIVGGGGTPEEVALCLTGPEAVPGAPAAPPPPPNPADVAQIAVTNMDLQPVGIGIVPENTPGKIGVVGAPTWMWVADPGQSTTGPMTRSATVGGVTVNAVATLDRIEWDMGDGSTVTCDGAGTPYYDGARLNSSPDCGYTYTQPSDRQPGLAYTVTATSYWTVNWEGGGGAGVIPQVLGNATQIQVGELQVIVTG